MGPLGHSEDQTVCGETLMFLEHEFCSLPHEHMGVMFYCKQAMHLEAYSSWENILEMNVTLNLNTNRGIHTRKGMSLAL